MQGLHRLPPRIQGLIEAATRGIYADNLAEHRRWVADIRAGKVVLESRGGVPDGHLEWEVWVGSTPVWVDAVTDTVFRAPSRQVLVGSVETHRKFRPQTVSAPQPRTPLVVALVRMRFKKLDLARQALREWVEARGGGVPYRTIMWPTNRDDEQWIEAWVPGACIAQLEDWERSQEVRTKAQSGAMP